MSMRRMFLIPLLLLANLASARAEARLIDAIKHQDKTAIGTLAKQPAQVNTSDPDGTTALHWAAYMDDVETANLLLHAGANVKATNRYGVTPLSLASVNANAAMLEMLLKAGADPN